MLDVFLYFVRIMRYVRFIKNSRKYFGCIESPESDIVKISKSSPWSKNFMPTLGEVPLKDVLLIPPTEASKIVCCGLNYKKHAEELGMDIPEEPIIFMKPPSAIIGHLSNINLAHKNNRIDYEAELAIVIKKRCSKVSCKNAKDYILGYTCLNDVSDRDIQKKDGQWTRAKGFDTYCPIGPWISYNIEDPNNLDIKCVLNSKVVQHSNTKDMIFSVEKIVSFVSHSMTLEPGDIIATGTPQGIGKLNPGDTVSIEIESIGTLTNFVV